MHSLHTEGYNAKRRDEDGSVSKQRLILTSTNMTIIWLNSKLLFSSLDLNSFIKIDKFNGFPLPRRNAYAARDARHPWNAWYAAIGAAVCSTLWPWWCAAVRFCLIGTNQCFSASHYTYALPLKVGQLFRKWGQQNLLRLSTPASSFIKAAVPQNTKYVNEKYNLLLFPFHLKLSSKVEMLLKKETVDC